MSIRGTIAAVLVAVSCVALAAQGSGPVIVQGAGRIYAGSGTPEGVITAPVGSMYLRTNGSTGTVVYVKESGSGNTGWVAQAAGSTTANALASATTTVNVSSATAPSSGQQLTATGSTAATWQTPSGGGSANGYTLQYWMAESVGTSGAPWPDSTTYYIGNPVAGYPAYLTTAYNIGKITIPKTGTIKAVTWDVHAEGVASSNENVAIYVRLNNTTDITVTTTADWSGSATLASGLNTGLSTAVTAGDTFIIKVVTPVWATNPSFVTMRGHIYIE